VLAARLLDADFLVVRVELRSLPSDTSVQEQIEQALYQTLGERVSWPELARGADGALPVHNVGRLRRVLQATGHQPADYLEQVHEFQRRESELGRPVAVTGDQPDRRRGPGTVS